MYILLLGLSIFFGIHLVPGLVGFRRRIITKLGEGTYQELYSVIALTGLILIVYGKSKAEFQPIWELPVWSAYVVAVLMLPAFIFLAAANLKSNIKRFTRHPMLWGIALWSGAHLLANGDNAIDKSKIQSIENPAKIVALSEQLYAMSSNKAIR
jgi:uncharacterized membrane protein